MMSGGATVCASADDAVGVSAIEDGTSTSERIKLLEAQLEKLGNDLQQASELNDVDGIKSTKVRLADVQNELNVLAGHGPMWRGSGRGPPVPFEPPRFDIRTQRAEFLAYLEEHGYAVSANVLSEESKLQDLRSKFWDFLEKYPPGTKVRRDDPESWNDKRWLPDERNGIIGGYGFGHSDFMWDLRLQPLVKATFAAIWEDDDLLVSFDGGNAFRPWQRNPEWRTDSGWWHVDQNASRGPQRQGKVCVQGLVTLLDATAETGGLCVIPGSHRQHKALCQRSAFAKSSSGDFVPVGEDDEVRSWASHFAAALSGTLAHKKH